MFFFVSYGVLRSVIRMLLGGLDVLRILRVIGRKLLDLLDLEQLLEIIHLHGRGIAKRLVAHRILIVLGRNLRLRARWH